MPTGAAAGDAEVRTLRSSMDPSQPADRQLDRWTSRTYRSPDGRYAFIGWSVRTTARAGRPASMSSTSPRSRSSTRLALPDGHADADGRPDLGSPRAAGSIPADGRGPRAHHGELVRGRSGDGRPAPGHGPLERRSPRARWATRTRPDRGPMPTASSGSTASSTPTCSMSPASATATARVRVERYDLDGTEIDRAEVGQFTGYGAFAARPDHRLFLWDPQSHTLMSYDLQTGRRTVLKVPDTAVLESPSDILSAIGRTVGSWIAPTATAKILLQPAMVVSPDGTQPVCDRHRGDRRANSAARPACSPSTSAATASPHRPLAAERGLHLARGERGRRVRLRGRHGRCRCRGSPVARRASRRSRSSTRPMGRSA